MLCRNRLEECSVCGGSREVTINLDTKEVIKARVTKGCIHKRKCVEDTRDRAFLGQHEDGKARVR